MTIEDYRRFYAEEIRFVAGLSSAALVEAFARVPRERFLGPGPWQVSSAEQQAMGLARPGTTIRRPVDDPRDLYHNLVVVLDQERNINNGQPSALARWIEALDLKPGNRLYHVGCGVGYYTAIMAEMVGAEGEVAAAEIEADLAARAKENLGSYANVTVHAADGAAFDPGECDAIFVNAGVTHPQALWLDRLREGGRLVFPLTITFAPKLGQGVMMKVTRRGSAWAAEVVTLLAIYSCAGLRNAEAEGAIKKALVAGALFKVKSLRRDAHDAAESCIVHTPEICLSALPV